jgi:hypothetical protein
MERVRLTKGKKGQRVALNKKSQGQIATAIKTGKLPHELLCMWAQDGYMEYVNKGEDGEPDIIEPVKLDPEVRILAAKCAAPYFGAQLKAHVLLPANEAPKQLTDQTAFLNARDLYARKINALAGKLERTEREMVIIDGNETVN